MQHIRVLYVPEKDRALKIHYPRIPMTGGGCASLGCVVALMRCGRVVFVENRACVILEFRFVSVVRGC
jgi:hypothetical protein